MDPIETAARAICEADVLSPPPDAPIMWKGKQAKAWEPRAAILRQAIEAGLFCHPAKVWLAPMEATKAMVTGYTRRSRGSRSIVGAPPFASAKGHFWDEAQNAWDALRDAHIKEQGDE